MTNTEEERFLNMPNTPKNKVTAVLISPQFPKLVRAVEKIGITVITTDASSVLPHPVRFHPDMLCCHVGKGNFFLLKSEKALQNKLECFDIQTNFTEQFPENTYPKDSGCNVLQISNHVFYNPKSADPALIHSLSEFLLHPVAQGYTRCSAAVVNETAAITADRGLSRAMKHAGLKVLEIRPGYIRLPGYNYGFIGGCCGLIAPDVLAFTGSLDTHPDGEQICSFLNECGVSWITLSNDPLLDIGGIIPLKEKNVK